MWSAIPTEKYFIWLQLRELILFYEGMRYQVLWLGGLFMDT